ncbi:MAG: hypothetical protein JRJ65_17390 [Deltaproteobacteria bacterium]|nr:hypothetical protein [Deltaproteobacteria bacterium]
MVYYADKEEMETPKNPKKFFMIIDGEKHYIDPAIVNKYDLENQETSFFSGRKLYFEEN